MLFKSEHSFQIWHHRLQSCYILCSVIFFMLKLLFFSILKPLWSKIKFGTLKPIRTIKSRRLITAESFIVAKVSFKFNFRLIWIKFQKNFSVLLKEEWIRSLSIRGSKDKILKNDPKNLLEKLKWILHAGNLTSHNKCSVSNRFKIDEFKGNKIKF